jgi:hypothetical protein
MKYFKYIKYLFLFLVIVLLTIIYFIKIDKIEYDNLMIIVHPEDGLIWGGNELSNNNYLVLCITCSNKDKDFINIMNKMNNDYVLLGYKDNTDFKDEYNILNRDLDYYINRKDWKRIITHNLDGEYGSYQNRYISELVTNKVSDKEKLYYFNKYYLRTEIYDNSLRLSMLSDEEYLEKIKYISMFEDIEYIKEFKHILRYEEFISYKEWGDLYE